MDKLKYQHEGLKWLAELELLENPQLINNLKFNIFSISSHIKEVELLIYRENKSMLVLLELSWIGRKFLKKGILNGVQDILVQILPNFRFRITEDPKIMEMAVNLIKTALSGGKYESDINPNNLNDRIPGFNRSSVPSNTSSTDTEPSAQSLKPDQKESSQVRSEISDGVSPHDCKEK